MNKYIRIIHFIVRVIFFETDLHINYETLMKTWNSFNSTIYHFTLNWSFSSLICIYMVAIDSWPNSWTKLAVYMLAIDSWPNSWTKLAVHILAIDSWPNKWTKLAGASIDFKKIEFSWVWIHYLMSQSSATPRITQCLGPISDSKSIDPI